MVIQEQENPSPADGSGIGARLRQARTDKSLSLADVSARLRVSERHLKMIEDGEFADLPARTYAVGFTRSYARLVGVDEVQAVADVRDILDSTQADRFRRVSSSFEPGDPARVPSAQLGWISALAVLLLLVGGFMFYRSFFSPAETLPPLAKETEAPAKPAAPHVAAVQPAVTGPVVFTSLEDGIWVKFYDGQGRQLMQKQMNKGETYVVPADAQGPRLWTGRPDALSITVGGRPVPKLAEAESIMKDVPVTAEALLARPPKVQQPVVAPSPTV
jgi:cytoskeleton protein RodZ